MKGYLREPDLSEWCFQRPDKLEQFEKWPRASWMIVSHANNHLLPLSEFASDKANYHLKTSSQTLWAKGWHHASRVCRCGRVAAHNTRARAHAHAAACCLRTGCRESHEGSDLIEGLFYCCIQLKLVSSPSDAAAPSAGRFPMSPSSSS